MSGSSPRTPAQRIAIALFQIFLAVALIGGVIVGVRGCFEMKATAYRYLDGRRGQPPSLPPDAKPDVREALEHLSRASRVELDTPSQFRGAAKFLRICGSGTLTVGGRRLPFAYVFESDEAGERLADTSLVRRTCKSRNKGALYVLE